MIYAGILCHFAVLTGAAFNLFDDAFSSSLDVPVFLQATVYLSGVMGAVVILSLIVSRLFRLRLVLTLVATGLVVLTFVFAMAVFRMTPLAEIIGTIRVGDDDVTLAWNSFFTRLYLCYCPVTIIFLSTLFLFRDRILFWGSVGCYGIGLVSAFLWGARHLNRDFVWLHPHKWGKFLSTGLLAAIFVLLVWLLARSLLNFRVTRHANGALETTNG